MVSSDMDLEHRRQLKAAGRLLSELPASMDDLLHILDQLEKLLEMVDQSPNQIMKEALIPSTKALVHGSLLEHPSMDAKVSVASCLCELIKITAPEQPYSDEEMRGVFRCIVSSLENLSDKSSRYYAKRIAILDNVAKVRACVIMLDIDCDDLVVELFEHFLKSVRDHHPENVFSLMVKIMAVVLEESEEVSPDILRTLLASVKNNVDVLPMARKLGEEVFKQSAVKLRPYINQAVAVLGDSLVDYSPLLTSICEGKTDFVDHDKSASVQSNAVDTAQSTVTLDDATQVIEKEERVIENAEDVSDTQVKKAEGDVDHPKSGLTRKLDTNDLNVESKPDTTESVKPVVSETVENVTEKVPEIVVSVEKPLPESEVTNAASQEESQSKIHITKGIRSKKKGPSQTVFVLTTVNEGTVDQEMKSPKRARKKTIKAEESNPSVTTGSDVEPVKSPRSKPVKRSSKKVGDDGPVAKKPKLSGKKVGSEVKPAKRRVKKDNETDSDGQTLKPSVKKRPRSKVITKPREEVVANKNEETDSDNTPLKQSVKKGQKSKVIITNPSEDVANKDEETESDNPPVNLSDNKGKETDSDPKPINVSENKDDEETDSDNIPLKLAMKRVVKSSSKNKDGKKQERGKTAEKKDQTKSLSEVDDRTDVRLKSVLKKATKRKGKDNSEGARSDGTKRKRSVTKKKVTKTIRYDASLVGKKVKVWWPEDETYYEGVVESFNIAEKNHKVLYLDGDIETLKLKKEKWEIIDEYSTPIKEVAVAVEAQNNNIIPETVGSSEGESKVNAKDVESKEGQTEVEKKEVKSKEDEEMMKDEKTQTLKKMVYSRGKKGSKNEIKSGEENMKESECVDAAEELEPENEKEKSTASQQIGSKSEEEKQEVN